MKERWKAIPEYEGYYEVSDQGRVRSLDRVITHERNKSYIRKGRLLSLTTHSQGYRCVHFTVNRKTKNLYVHRLVLQAFMGNKKGMDCNHINGAKHDNRLKNLEWCTRSENIQHAFDTGLRKDLNRKLQDEEVLSVCKDLLNGVTNKEISEKYNVESSLISQIATEKSYKDITVGFFKKKKYIRKDSILNSKKVEDIFLSIQNGFTRKSLAKKYSVSIDTVHKIMQGKNWVHVTNKLRESC